jgi:predicted ATP-dependent endonuclease of OLD family
MCAPHHLFFAGKVESHCRSRYQKAVAMADVDGSGPQGSDEYVDGSIFRVKLHNFLTYSDAEFYPGPRLNLILGPNGTGKSSIVCALCVGLAGSTKLLGRADKVGQFVRHEKESGYTEIELFFEGGNKVIRRNIFRDNKSTWQVNGRDSTLKNVAGIMEAASIQIDNLCQFLPQDKVGEFSRMNNVQLLKATENAITDSDLAAKHDEIVELQHSMSDKGRVRSRRGKVAQASCRRGNGVLSVGTGTRAGGTGAQEERERPAKERGGAH